MGKREFKKGQRVSVEYLKSRSWLTNKHEIVQAQVVTKRGTIRDVKDGALLVTIDDGASEVVSPRQCVPLKKRERRRVWVDASHFKGTHQFPVHFTDPNGAVPEANWIEFVEVRKK